jgi:hypothetical protein
MIGRRKRRVAEPTTTPELICFVYPRIVRAGRESDAEQIRTLLDESSALFSPEYLFATTFTAVGYAAGCARHALEPHPIRDDDVAALSPYAFEAARLFPAPPPDDYVFDWLRQVTGDPTAIRRPGGPTFTILDLSSLLSIAAGVARRDQWTDGLIQAFFDVVSAEYERRF